MERLNVRKSSWHNFENTIQPYAWRDSENHEKYVRKSSCHNFENTIQPHAWSDSENHEKYVRKSS